jgi:hypothetical protein
MMPRLIWRRLYSIPDTGFPCSKPFFMIGDLARLRGRAAHEVHESGSNAVFASTSLQRPVAWEPRPESDYGLWNSNQSYE